MSRGVLVKAVNYQKNNSTFTAVISGWNVDKGIGAAVIFVQDHATGNVNRIIIKFIPSYASNCFQPNAECVDGLVMQTDGSNSDGSVHLEADNSTLIFAYSPSKSSAMQDTLSVTGLRIWLKPIAAQGNSSTVVLKEGERDGPLLVQKIYPDRIEGLNFIEYPIATNQGHPITLHVGEKASNGCTIALMLVKIGDGAAVFVKTIDQHRPCPICWTQQAMYLGHNSAGY